MSDVDHLVEMLSEYVHEAWMKEKIKQGYADHPFQGEQENWPCDAPRCGRADFRHHTDMLPYADLPERIKEYDRVTVRAVLAGLDKAGYKIWIKT